MANDGLTVTADFPGGNIIVDKIDGDLIQLHQDPRDTIGWWFYWSCAIATDVPRTVRVQFTNGNVVGPLGPAVSTNGGRSWSWLGAEHSNESGFSAELVPGPEPTRFCMTVPYQLSDLDQFATELDTDPNFRRTSLCTSRAGRPVPLWRFGAIDSPQHRILLTVRHHACETMASFELEGITRTVLGESSSGAWLRENVEFVAVPFMDIDGVENGDQGKNRAPHDHNRDYRGQSVYPEVDALRNADWIWNDGRCVAALDLHCPSIRGSGHHDISVVEPGPPATCEAIAAFSDCLVATTRHSDVLPYDPQNNLRFGQSWNTDENGPRQTFSWWAGQLPGVKLAATIELPYSITAAREVNSDTARAFGVDVAGALADLVRKQL